MRLATDSIEFCSEHMPRFHPFVEDTYYISDGSVDVVDEMALGFVELREVVRRLVARGVDVDRFAPRIALLVNCRMDFFAEIAKIRASRRLYARMMRDEFGARDPRSLAINVAAHTSGATMTSRQIANNIARGAIQARRAHARGRARHGDLGVRRGDPHAVARRAHRRARHAARRGARDRRRRRRPTRSAAPGTSRRSPTSSRRASRSASRSSRGWATSCASPRTGSSARSSPRRWSTARRRSPTAPARSWGSTSTRSRPSATRCCATSPRSASRPHYERIDEIAAWRAARDLAGVVAALDRLEADCRAGANVMPALVGALRGAGVDGRVHRRAARVLRPRRTTRSGAWSDRGERPAAASSSPCSGSTSTRPARSR